MNFKPLSNHLFLEAVEEEKTTASGIVLPETVEKEKPVKAKVVAVGPGKKNDKGEIQPMAVKIGDMVLFKKYGPDEFELEGKKYLVGDEDDILAVIEIDGGGISKEEIEGNRQSREQQQKNDTGL
jgi:chaperonin GroES